MLSLDIATVQPSLQNHLVPLRAQTLIHCNALPSPWKSSQLPNNVNIYAGNRQIRRGKLLITAVATFETKSSVQKEDGQNNSQLSVNPSPLRDQHKTSSEDTEELDEKERLRRMRISKANRGNTPWNKGRKHSAETLQRIRERTKLAMQDPKVKMKLVNFGHAQSEETKAKIGVGVRVGWERRRQKLMLQETCYFEWQNLIAEAARRGYVGEEGLKWDSYKILDKQLTQDWLESVEQRKTAPRPKGSKRAPKSPEQRRKIAEAIAAKWADPIQGRLERAKTRIQEEGRKVGKRESFAKESTGAVKHEYRERVCSALTKYHGVPVGAERKPRRKPSGTTQSTRRNHVKRNASDANTSSRSETRSQIERLRLRKSNTPLYKDPLASSKLELIKNIRAQRVAEESKKIEAIERARLLIAEAEKAAKALEVAAMKSPIAQASLMETRKLIAEAIQSIESIETGQITSNENGIYPSVASAELLSQVEKETELENGGKNQGDQREVNGTKFLSLSENEYFNFANLTMQGMVNGEEMLPPSSSGYGLPTFNLDGLIKSSVSTKQLGSFEPNGIIKWEKNPQPNRVKVHQLESNGNIKCENNPLPNGARVHVMEEEVSPKPVTVTKKWVCGRLVEVTEGA